MTITLTSKEFDEAVFLWLQDQGFSTDTHSISTRVIAGRSDGPLGTRLEVTLDTKPKITESVFEAMGLTPTGNGTVVPTHLASTFSQRASQNTSPEWKGTAEGGGHADE